MLSWLRPGKIGLCRHMGSFSSYLGLARTLSSLPRRLRRRTPTHTPLIASSFLQPLLRAQFQLPIQLRTRLFPMYKITESSSHAPLSTIEPTTCLPEIGDRTQLAIYRPRRIPPRIQRITCLLRILLVLEPCIHIAN